MIWKIRTQEKIIFLTFDDGPDPDITPQVLSVLSAHHAKATFFCIGENIERQPEVFGRIKQEGHAVGNHTWSHLKGWSTSLKIYTEDAARSSIFFPDGHAPAAAQLFRPPYGKMTFSQFQAMKKKYRIVMWNILSRDWEQDRSAESCFRRIKKKAGPGSIVVFHDSPKAKSRMLPALEKTLHHFSDHGYRFESLEKHV